MAQKSLAELIETSIENIEQDRSCAFILLNELMAHIRKDVERNKDYGAIASKYLETLQRSNEQLVKLAELKRKQQEKEDEDLSEDDKEDLFDEIKSAARKDKAED
jgi:hypothetical protein